MTMSVTQEDLRDFNHFAGEKLANGADTSIVELAREWEAQHRECKQLDGHVSGIPIDIDAATLKRLIEAFPEVPDEVLKQRASDRRGGVTTEQLLRNAAAAAARAAQQ
jgi:hypothetical protein